MNFKKHEPVAPAIPHKAAPTLTERLEAHRDALATELTAKEAQLIELDTQIAWLKRHPQVEKIIESLRGR